MVREAVDYVVEEIASLVAYKLNGATESAPYVLV